MSRFNAFSDNDVRILNEVISDYRQLRRNPPARYEEEGTHQAPDTYVAYVTTPIPKLQGPTVTGTGTGGVDGDTPGSGDCDLYTIRISDGVLEGLGKKETVYNLTDNDIPAGWLPITKDKFGRWIALISGSTSSNPVDVSQCGCCDGFLCIDSSLATVLSCDACPDGAPEVFYIQSGIWSRYPEMTPNGVISLWSDLDDADCNGTGTGSSYSVTPCLWVSCPIEVFVPGTGTGSGSGGSSGIYQWQAVVTTIIIDTGIGTLELPFFECIPVLLSGDDVIGNGFAETW